MHDYKCYLPHHRELEQMRERDDRFIKLVSVWVSVLALICLVWLVCMVATDAVVKTAEIQEQYYSKPVSATYSRPAAYRMASPTADQMDHMEHLATIQPLVRK